MEGSKQKPKMPPGGQKEKAQPPPARPASPLAPASPPPAHARPHTHAHARGHGAAGTGDAKGHGAAGAGDAEKEAKLRKLQEQEDISIEQQVRLTHVHFDTTTKICTRDPTVGLCQGPYGGPCLPLRTLGGPLAISSSAAVALTDYDQVDSLRFRYESVNFGERKSQIG